MYYVKMISERINDDGTPYKTVFRYSCVQINQRNCVKEAGVELFNLQNVSGKDVTLRMNHEALKEAGNTEHLFLQNINGKTLEMYTFGAKA